VKTKKITYSSIYREEKMWLKKGRVAPQRDKREERGEKLIR